MDVRDDRRSVRQTRGENLIPQTCDSLPTNSASGVDINVSANLVDPSASIKFADSAAWPRVIARALAPLASPDPRPMVMSREGAKAATYESAPRLCFVENSVAMRTLESEWSY